MSITLVEHGADEAVTREEFMTALQSAIESVSEFGDHVELTITTLHRQNEDEGQSHLLLGGSSGTPLFLVTDLSYDHVDTLLEYMRNNFSVTQFSGLALTHLNNLMMSVYGQEHSDVSMSQEIHTHIFKKAAYQGLASVLRLIGRPDGALEISYTLSAEIFADTSGEESAFLKAQGLEPSAYQTSSPNKQVPLFSLELHPLVKIQ